MIVHLRTYMYSYSYMHITTQAIYTHSTQVHVQVHIHSKFSNSNEHVVRGTLVRQAYVSTGYLIRRWEDIHIGVTINKPSNQGP